MMWKTEGHPEAEALLTLKDHRRVIGYWDGVYWWYDGKYHLEDEVIMWIEMSDVLEVTKWLECLDHYGLMK